jgi:trans-2-enoyl-CoA reductase
VIRLSIPHVTAHTSCILDQSTVVFEKCLVLALSCDLNVIITINLYQLMLYQMMRGKNTHKKNLLNMSI